jgi:hypothetical protein
MEEETEYEPDVYDQADWYVVHFPDSYEQEDN